MGTSRETLMEWFKRGVEQKATHMVVVCDTFDYDDYPVYVDEGESPQEAVKAHSGNMQRVMEVYNLKLPMNPQMIGGTRVWNY
jgi:hypothetical protein